ARNRYTYYGRRGAFLERFQTFGGGVGFMRYDRPGDGFFEFQLSDMNTATFRGGWQASFTPTRTRYTLNRADYTRFYVATPTDTTPLVLPDHPTAFMSSFGITTPQLRRLDA